MENEHQKISESFSDKPKQCPFCGSTPREHIIYKWYRCPSGGCLGSKAWVTLLEWNTRPVEDALQAEVDNLKHLIAKALKGMHGTAFTDELKELCKAAGIKITRKPLKPVYEKESL